MGSALLAGRFTLVDPVGHGGSGTVWRAFDHRLGRYCAVKLIRHVDAGGLPRFVREQAVRLSHPHLVCPYAWAADDDVLIAMDLVRGGSVAALIRDNGPLPAHYVARVAGQVLAGLDRLHRAGFLHRDVTPANLLLEVTGQGPPHARLADFGLVLPRAGPRLTQAGHLPGTPGYVPPEALAGHPPDERRDLYATGIVAWQMLTGAEEPPRTPAWRDRPPPGVPRPFWDAVRGLAAAAPDDRPADAAAAGAMLAAATRGLPDVYPALTEAGEPVEVFDVLGPPPGAVPPPAGPPDPPGRPVILPPAPPGGDDGTAGVPLPDDGNAEVLRSGDGAAEVLRSGDGAAGVARSGGGTGRGTGGWRAGAAAMAVAVGAGAAGTMIYFSGAGAPGGSPAAVPADAPYGGASPVEAPYGEASPAEVPYGGASPAAGEPCGWQDVGLLETAADGTRLRCTWDDGDYSWRTATARPR